MTHNEIRDTRARSHLRPKQLESNETMNQVRLGSPMYVDQQSKPQRGLEPTNLPITSRLRYRLRHWGVGFGHRRPALPNNKTASHRSTGTSLSDILSRGASRVKLLCSFGCCVMKHG